MERMVDNVSQTGLRVGSLNQCWMVIGNRNRPLAVIRVALRVHDQGSQETPKKKIQRNDSNLLTMVLWVVHLQVHSWLSLVLDSIPCRVHCVGWSHKCGIFMSLWWQCSLILVHTMLRGHYSVSCPKLPTPHPVTQTRKRIWSVRFICIRPCELIPYQKHT
jgi:hypothetical protein